MPLPPPPSLPHPSRLRPISRCFLHLSISQLFATTLHFQRREDIVVLCTLGNGLECLTRRKIRGVLGITRHNAGWRLAFLCSLQRESGYSRQRRFKQPSNSNVQVWHPTAAVKSFAHVHDCLHAWWKQRLRGCGKHFAASIAGRVWGLKRSRVLAFLAIELTKLLVSTSQKRAVMSKMTHCLSGTQPILPCHSDLSGSASFPQRSTDVGGDRIDRQGEMC